MKVLTIKEPFASLIKDKYKEYETRSWKTNYRGEILINAGLSKDNLRKSNDERLKSLCKLVNVNRGFIICQATLTECILIDKEFIDTLSPMEIKCGDYTLGRYAWHLENIRVIKPIKVKGSLGIWNYEV